MQNPIYSLLLPQAVLYRYLWLVVLQLNFNWHNTRSFKDQVYGNGINFAIGWCMSFSYKKQVIVQFSQYCSNLRINFKKCYLLFSNNGKQFLQFWKKLSTWCFEESFQPWGSGCLWHVIWRWFFFPCLHWFTLLIIITHNVYPIHSKPHCWPAFIQILDNKDFIVWYC